MAEELNAESTPMSDLSAFDTSSSYVPGAELQKFDAYQNVVGNPITGSNPQSNLQLLDTSNTAENFDNKIRQSIASYENPYDRMRPFTYNGDYDGANFERYHSTEQYKTLGFSPYRDNESLYNNNMTMGDQFARAASQWDNLVATGFKSGVKSWGTLFTDPLAPDMESANEMKRAMAIGSSSAGGLAGFATNTFLNSGFTIGIAADFVAEELALAAVTAFTGGLSGGATGTGMMAKAGMTARRLAGFGEAAAEIGKTLNKGAEVERLARAGKEGNEALRTMKNGLNSVSEMQTFWNTAGGKFAKGAFDVVNPLDNTFKALKATDYASGLAKTAKTFGSFVDDVIQIKGAVSESVLEGGMAKMDVTEKLIDKYRADHFGLDPEGEELTKIENLASQEAHRVALYNLPAISISNKFLYATMVAPISKLIGRGTSNSLNSILFKKPLKGVQADAPFEVLGQGIRARASAAVKSLAKPQLYGKYGMDYLKANFAEGIQENLQDAISTGAVEHALATYTDPAKATYEGYMGYFMAGLDDQFSAKGAETFAGGLAMGMFAQPVMGSASWTINRLSEVVNRKEVAAYKANKEAQDQRDAAALNNLYKDDLRFFAPDLKNSIRQQGLAKDFHTAVQNGDEKKARDAQFDSIQSHLSTAIRTGKLDIFLDKLAQYKSLEPKAALEAFSKYGISTEEDAVKAQGQIDGVIERAKKLRNKSENIGSEFPNPYNYQQYQAGTALHSATVKAAEAWEEAKQNLLYAESAFDDHADRVAKMATTFSAIADSIGKADAQTFMRLLDPNDTIIELATLKKELEALDPTLPEQKKLIKDKQKTFDLLSEYHMLVKEGQKAEVADKKGIAKETKKSFKKYVKHVSDKNNTIVFDTNVEKAYQLILDSHTLKNEMRGLARSINVLNNPQGFLNTQERIYTAFEELNKEKIVKDNQGTSGTVILNNKVHNAMGELGIKLPEEFMDLYNEAVKNKTELPIPEYFINPKTNEEVTEGETFDKAMEIWKGFLEVLPKEEKKVVVKKEPIVNEEGDAEFRTFPAGLMTDLGAMFTQAMKDGVIPENDTIGNFIKTNPDAILQIKLANTEANFNKEKEAEAEKPTVASAKIETAPSPEAVEYLNMMGYTNTQIKELSREERTNILKNGIVAEDYYKISTSEITPAEQKIAEYRAQEKKELAEKLPNLEDYIVNGEVDTESMQSKKPADFEIYDEIYRRYNKLITNVSKGETVENIEDVLKKEKFRQNNISKAYIKDGKEGNIYVEKNKDNTYTISGFKYKKDSEGNYIQAGFQSASGQIINLGYERDMKSKISETVSSEEVVSTINKISQTISPDLEILENKPVEVVKADIEKRRQGEDDRNKYPGIKELLSVYNGGALFFNIDASGLEVAESLNANNVTADDIFNIRNTIGGKIGDWFERGFKELTGKTYEQYDSELASLESKPVEEVKEVPGSPINDAYIGKVIFMTPGSGKEELAKNNIDVVDADDIILQTAQDLNPGFKPETSLPVFKQIGRAIDAVGKEELYKKAYSNMRELANKGKTVITGSVVLMKVSDMVMIQRNDSLIPNNYDIITELAETNNLKKEIPVIAVEDVASTFLTKTPEQLLGKVKVVDETIENQDLTVDDINKNINEQTLGIAKEKGFDAVFKNERYAIVKINKKTVSLKPVSGNPISVKIEDITSVVSSEEVPVTKEEIDLFTANLETLKEGDIVIDKTVKNLTTSLNNIVKNVCP